MFEDSWSHSSVCYRRLHTNNDRSGPKIDFNFGNPATLTMFDSFTGLLFPDFITDTIISKINSTIAGDPVFSGEFVRWIGLWFLMATVTGPSRNEFFLHPLSCCFKVHHSD